MFLFKYIIKENKQMKDIQKIKSHIITNYLLQFL